MKLIAATNNAHKLTELRAILSGSGVTLLSMKDAGLSMEIEENGTTFEENAMIKARTVYEATGIAAMADDSGLEIDALNGAPGVYSARYAGDNATDLDRIEKVWREMERSDDKSRGAQFVCAIACVLDDNTAFTVRGVCRGEIINECRGDGGFGYDPCFLVPHLNKTYSEITAEEKNRISHRGNALTLFVEELKHRKGELDANE